MNGTMSDHLKQEISELYFRYKHLVMTVCATMLMEEIDPDAVATAERLVARARKARRAARGSPMEPVFWACEGAVKDLAGRAAEWLQTGLPPDESVIGQLREEHRTFRQQMWNLGYFEYVPCSAEDAGSR